MTLVGSVSAVPQTEKEALIDFYISTNGQDWTDDSNWEILFDTYNNNSINTTNTDSQLCNAYGLQCDDELNHIIKLEFINNNLNGTIPDSIEYLSHLKTFVFEEEFRLFGTIPETIYNITSMEAFVLIDVSINGKISSNIIKWQDSLLELSLIATQLNDSLISSHQLWQLNNLIIFDLQINFNLTVEISNNLCNFQNIEYIYLNDIPGIYGIFPDSCICQSWTHLRALFIGYWAYYDNIINVTGTIDSCLANISPNMSDLSIYQTRISGEILSHQNCTWTKIVFLWITVNNLNGTISQSCMSNIFESAIKYKLGIIPSENLGGIELPQYNFGFNVFSGSLPTVLDTNVQALFNLTTTDYNYNISNCWIWSLSFGQNDFSGSIPNYMTQCEIQLLYMDGNNFNGTLPSNWRSHCILLDNNQLTGTLSDTFIDESFNQVYSIHVGNNKLYGSIPSVLFNKQPYLATFEAGYNEFDSLPDLSKSEINNNVALLSFDVSNNKIVEDNIGKYLNILFGKYTNLMAVLFHSNSKLSGNIAKWNGKIETKNSEGIFITLHKCDIWGKLPQTLFAQNLKFFSLFNNRLSGNLNSNVTVFEDVQGYAILGNFFTINNEVNWIDSSFMEARNLYQTINGIVLSYMCICFGAICYVLVVVYKLKQTKDICNQSRGLSLSITLNNINNSNDTRNRKYTFPTNVKFQETVKFIFNSISHPIILICSLILHIIYYQYSNYYSEGRPTSQISLIYFTFSHNDKNTLFTEISLVLIYLCMNGLVLYQLFQFEQRIYGTHNNTNNNSRKHSFKHNSMQQVLLETELMLEHGITDDNNDDENDESDPTDRKDSVTDTPPNWKKLLLFSMLYLLSLVFTIMYAIVEHIPNDNILLINHNWQRYIFTYFIAFVLTISTIYSIPRVVSNIPDININIDTKCNNNINISFKIDVTNHRTSIIMLLRTFSTITIPFGISFLILNECGSYWSKFWKKCVDDENSFSVSENVSTYYNGITATVLEHNDVCGRNDLTDINVLYNCQRHILDWWVPVVTLKVILLTVYPFYLLFKAKYRDKINKCKKWLCGCAPRDTHLCLDAEYGVLATKLEISIIFMTISPYILIICCVGILTTMYGFKKLTNEYGYKIIHWNSKKFPVYFLFISLCFEQFLIVFFCFNAFRANQSVIFMCVLFGLFDVAFIATSIRHHVIFKLGD